MASLRRSLISVHRILKSSQSFADAASSQDLYRTQYRWVSGFSPIANNNTQSLDIDLSNEESKRRLFNRLLYRSKQRGFLELDLVLGKWVEKHIHSMDENGIKALVHVLDLVSDTMEGCWVISFSGAVAFFFSNLPEVVSFICKRQRENPDLWKWLTGQEQPPEAVKINSVFTAVRDKVMNNLNSHAAPETRATPGQPWVRGWDDIKKGPGGPIAGNQ